MKARSSVLIDKIKTTLKARDEQQLGIMLLSAKKKNLQTTVSFNHFVSHKFQTQK